MAESEANTAFNGLNVFVVEDEAIIAMMLEDILSDIGCTVVGPALGLDQAREIIGTNELPGAAILDVNVAGQPVYPIAEMLAAKGVPLIFATGYGAAGLAEAWRGRVTVQKPYTQDDIIRALKAAIAAP